MLLVILAANVVLILVGISFAPDSVGSPLGVGIVAADIGMQFGLAAVACIGPIALHRLGGPGSICAVAAAAFALTYDGLLLADLEGRPLPLNPYLFFVTAALVVGFVLSYVTRRIGQGVLGAIWTLLLGTALWSAGFLVMIYTFWGTHHEYLFWLRDGAVNDFHRSGERNLGVFLLQDIQGALFFHPLLSFALGLAVGAVGASVGFAAGRLRERFSTSEP